MLDKKTINAIKTIALDDMVQLEVINSMFHGCERGTDLWEGLESSRESFFPETQAFLWGDILDEDEEEETHSDLNALCYHAAPHEVICALIDEVENLVRKTILREP